MALCGIFYAVFFGLPAFLMSNLTSIYGSQQMGCSPFRQCINYYNLTIIETISREALALILVGLAMMFGAWILGNRIVFARIPALKFGGIEHVSRAPGASVSPAHDIAPGITLGLAIFLALANLAYWAVLSVRELPSVGQFLQPAGYVAFGLLYLLRANGRLPRWLTIVYFWVILPLWLMNMAVTGFLTPIILLICLWLALRTHTFGSIPWKPALAGVLVFVWIYPHISEYRANYWRLQKDEPTITKLAGFGNILIERTWSNGLGSKHFSTRPFQGLVQRLSLNLQFSTVVDKTPDRIPYWQGTTYRSLFLSWVPRVVWKGKPEERWGNEFGRRYQFLAPENTSMSVNLPWLVELYANFGAKGVVIGMLLIGLLLAFLERLLSRPESDTVSKAVGAAVLLPLFYHESNFTVMTGSLLPLIFCLWIYFNVPARLLARRCN